MLLSFGFQSTRGQRISFWNVGIGGSVDCTIKLLLAHVRENKSARKKGDHFNVNISGHVLQESSKLHKIAKERGQNYVLKITANKAFEM